MGTGIASNKNLSLGLAALTIVWITAAYLFRDSLGLVVFLVLGVVTFAQLVRVAVFGGNGKVLKGLWSALKDAFWGM